MNLLLVVSPEEKSKYLHLVTDYISGHKVKVFSGEIVTASQIYALAKQHNIDGIITNRVDFVAKHLPSDRVKKVNLTNYVGSLFTSYGLPCLVVYPFRSVIMYTYGKWLMSRLISKITEPEKWEKASEFKWTEVDSPEKEVALMDDLSTGIAAAVDIETAKGELPITTSISYTILRADRSTMTHVFEIDSMDKVRIMRAANATEIPKILQNGKYDAAYLFAYSAPLIRYIGDTVNAMHSWYAELPKDLAFIAALFIRETIYWKDLAQSPDRGERLGYNARDTWATLEAFMAWMNEAPKWARENYVKEFVQVPICHAMEMTGVKRNLERLKKHAEHLELEAAGTLGKIRTRLASPLYNPNSSKQTVQLMHLLGDKQAESSEEKHLVALSHKHPLNALCIEPILEYRGQKKLLSTYLTSGEKAKEFRKTRILTAINPHGTDTKRKASKEHHFWCGLNIQNIPDNAWQVKDTIEADEGYEFFEFDYSQAEARGVAYCSGDQALLAAVNSGRDFHSLNASAFFGVPYEQIYDDLTGKTLDKPLRNLSKRVNHGANYNMGERVLLETMGAANVREAQRLLQLDPRMSLIEVCRFLLNRYEVTYPRVKGVYYNKIIRDVRTTQKLVGATGWTRYCFGEPWANKPALNSYVAHVTQSLNADILDMAVEKVWNEFGLDHRVKFIAQIHDSLLLQIKIDPAQENIAKKVKKLMTFPVPVTDCVGVTREMTVPVDIKNTGRFWSGHKE